MNLWMCSRWRLTTLRKPCTPTSIITSRFSSTCGHLSAHLLSAVCFEVHTKCLYKDLLESSEVDPFFWLHPTSSTTFRSLSKSSSWVMHKQTQGESFLPPEGARNLLVATCFVRYLRKREKENDQRVSPGSWNWHTVHNLTDIKFRFVSLCHTHTLCLEKDQVKQPTCMSECCYSPSVWDAGEVSELPKHFPYKFDSNCQCGLVTSENKYENVVNRITFGPIFPNHATGIMYFS